MGLYSEINKFSVYTFIVSYYSQSFDPKNFFGLWGH